MGDSLDPSPESLEISDAIHNSKPYISFKTTALQLPPAIIWEIVAARRDYQLQFIEHVNENSISYQSLTADKLTKDNDSLCQELLGLLRGDTRDNEELRLAHGERLDAQWTRLRNHIEERLKVEIGALPWGEFDPNTLAWYAKKLDPESGKPPRQLLSKKLFNNKTSGFSQEEMQQATLLFGKKDAITRILQGTTIDLRWHKDKEQRWDERIECSANLIESLKVAVEFFAKHINLEGTTADNLSERDGSADYVVMREALVNQFIHQDYNDRKACAQLEVTPAGALFFNMGYALLDKKSIIEGGRSTSRNPLIARAFRLIGFAELAGSGIRELQRVWREARRRPPVIQSDKEENNYTLTLDWREVPTAYDEHWKQKAGIELTEDQAMVLNLTKAQNGTDQFEAASGTGLPIEEARVLLSFLVRQVVVEEREGRFYIKGIHRGELE
jgi:hypothetical protein